MLSKNSEGAMPSASSDSPDGERLPLKPDWLTDEDFRARSLVFLVTFAAVLDETTLEAQTPLKSLDGFSRMDIKDAVLGALANPVQDASPQGGRPRLNKLEALKLVVFLEEPRHFHAALRLSAASRFLPFKTALRRRTGLASHWSTTHTQWWSAVRYGVFTTAHKHVVDQEPLVWVKGPGVLEPHQTGPGAVQEYRVPGTDNVIVDLYEEAQQPYSASLWIKRRQKAEAAAAGEAAVSGKKTKAVKFTPLDFTALVLDKGLRTPNAVLAYVQEHGSQAAQLYCLRNQKRFSGEMQKSSMRWKWRQIGHWSSALLASCAVAERTASGWRRLGIFLQEPCHC